MRTRDPNGVIDTFVDEANTSLPATLTAALTLRVKTSVADRYGQTVANLTYLEVPAHPTLEEVRGILDPLERHISFGRNWEQRAADDLDPLFASKVRSLPLDVHKLIDAVAALRNLIAHGSPSATRQADIALVTLDPGVDGQLRTSRSVTGPSVAHYLHTQVGGIRRVETYHRRLSEIAQSLRVQPSRPSSTAVGSQSWR